MPTRRYLPLFGYSIVILLLAWALVYFFWLLPNRELEASRDILQPKEFLELKDGIRTGFAQAVGGTVLLLGLFFTWRNLRASEANLRLTQATSTKSLQIAEETLRAAVEERLATRLTQAVEQLGSDRVEIRLQGIYTLERQAKANKPDHWQIMETLTTHVRRYSHREIGEDSGEKLPTGEIQAICNVLCRREVAFDPIGQHLDLQWANLKAICFKGGNLSGANFSGCDLKGADFSEANLSNTTFDLSILDAANFVKAVAERAQFVGISAQEANFLEAQLPHAAFSNADLGLANFRSANLSGSSLYGCNLRSASLEYANLSHVGLQEAQLSDAKMYAANLESANLFGAHLGRASLKRANFSKANLRSANLAEADLTEAEFDETAFAGANLHLANLRGARMETSIELRLPDVFSATLDENTKLPAKLQQEVLDHPYSKNDQ